jgi:hypothetical protein
VAVDVGASAAAPPRGVLRHSSRDAVLVALSLVHGAALAIAPSVPLVAIGLWWNANTIAHNFIHTPFFRARELNVLFSVYLSGVLGIPQTLWRDRHLQHHAGRDRSLTLSPLLMVETGVVAGLWVAMAVLAPSFFVGVYLPGYAIGLCLCFLQGYFEHAHGTTSHYGWIYNVCFFNDGYHVEHHRHPGKHWTRLPEQTATGAQHSAWPPVLRWLDGVSLEALERIVLTSPRLQRLVLACHARALRKLVARIPHVSRVTIVGGGLFPRTALILRDLLPDAAIAIVDDKREHLEIARSFLDRRADGADTHAQACCAEAPARRQVTFRHELYDPRTPDSADLLVIPLAFIGDRQAFYCESPARWTLIHDWLWNRHADGVLVSLWLLKRLNLVAR